MIVYKNVFFSCFLAFAAFLYQIYNHFGNSYFVCCIFVNEDSHARR